VCGTPIIHPDRNIGDTAELIPGSVAGARGPLKEILRTQGDDEDARLLTLTIVGPPVYTSSLSSDSSESRGPLFAVVEWGVKGGRSTVELDIPQGGVTMSLVASYLRVSARYDGMVLLNGAKMDHAAYGGQDPGPTQRVGAFVGYGSYGRSSRLTRTVRLDNIPHATEDDGVVPGSSPMVRVPAFARHVTVTAANPAGFALSLFGPKSSTVPLDFINMDSTVSQATVALPGDCVSVILNNYNLEAVLTTPALTFDLAL
jgi:hypothetical protein